MPYAEPCTATGIAHTIEYFLRGQDFCQYQDAFGSSRKALFGEPTVIHPVAKVTCW